MDAELRQKLSALVGIIAMKALDEARSRQGASPPPFPCVHCGSTHESSASYLNIAKTLAGILKEAGQ
jgi:hypothetical protein